MMFVGGRPAGAPSPAEEAIARLAEMKRAILSFPESHESAVDVDRIDVLRRMDMIAMTAAAVRHQGPRPELLASIERDAAFALAAATDAIQRGTWDVGRQLARSLMDAATMLSTLAVQLTR